MTSYVVQANIPDGIIDNVSDIGYPARHVQDSLKRSKISVPPRPANRRIPYINVLQWDGDPTTQWAFVNQLSIFAYFHSSSFRHVDEKMLWTVSLMTGYAGFVVHQHIAYAANKHAHELIRTQLGKEIGCNSADDFLYTYTLRCRGVAKRAEMEEEGSGDGGIVAAMRRVWIAAENFLIGLPLSAVLLVMWTLIYTYWYSIPMPKHA